MRRSSGLFCKFIIPVVLFVLVFGGCSTRSISDSGYRNNSGYRGGESNNPLYKGELSEFEVLGINPETKITQEDISRSFESKQQLALQKCSSLMVIQSGATIPDEPMIKALGKYYNVSVFSGVPVVQNGNNYAMSIRLVAAKGGYEKIIAYWGILETAQKGLGTKAVSWVPFVGGLVPDESQEMRLRLKVALIDVKTGQWDMFSPESFQDASASARYVRESADQGQVATLKAKAYDAAVEDLAKRYSK